MSNSIIKWGERHAKALEQLLLEYNNAEIKYFILRNYEGLPEVNFSKDVDIIIEPGSYCKASKILKKVLCENEFQFLHVVKYERVRCWYAADLVCNLSLHIDLIEGYLSKGFEFFKFDELYQNSIAYKEFRVLDDHYDAAMLLFYKLISSKELKLQYREKISSIYCSNPSSFQLLIEAKVGRKLSSKICKLIENSDFEKLEQLSEKISKGAKLRAFNRNPFKTFFRVISFLCEKIYRIIICPQKFRNFIAVMGADGSGKTTFIDNLVNEIEFYYVGGGDKCRVYHHRPTMLPNLGSVAEKAKIKEVDADFSRPHRAKPAGFFSSMVRMKYYWVDYLIGGNKILRKDAQFDRFTIFDRYVYDFLVDPHRSRISLPYWIRKTFTRLVPQPRIVFILATDAKTIYERKQELTLEEIERQLVELRKLAKSNKRFVILDASKSPEQLVQEAMGLILERFTQRIK